MKFSHPSMSVFYTKYKNSNSLEQVATNSFTKKMLNLFFRNIISVKHAPSDGSWSW